MTTDARLQQITVSDFRSIQGSWTIPLDAEIVLLHGPNGSGKSSLLSAIELAATGRIHSLDRTSDLSYMNNLQHRSTGSGHVAITISGESQSASQDGVRVSPSGISGEPALSSVDATFFAERCFLAQSVLGRLLELYAPHDVKTTSSLVSFVKELVGIDELDALIEGLDASGHVSRSKSQSLYWKSTEQLAQSVGADLTDAESQLHAVDARLEVSTAELRGLLPIGGEDSRTVNELLEIAQTRRSEMAPTAGRISELSLRVKGLAVNARQLPEVEGPGGLVPPRSVQAIDEDITRWWSEHESALRESLAVLPANLVDTTVMSPTNVSGLWKDALEATNAASAEATLRLTQAIAIESEVGRLAVENGRVIEARDEIGRRRAGLMHDVDAAALVDVLRLVEPHIDGSKCPVCDQQYTGHDGENLEQHVRAKLSQLTAGMEAIAEIDVEMNAANAAVESSTRVLEDLRQRQAVVPQPALLRDEIATLVSARESLETQSSRLTVLTGLLSDRARSRSDEARSAETNSLRLQVSSAVEEISSELGIGELSGDLADRASTLGSLVESLLVKASEFDEAEKRIEDAVASQLSSTRDRDRLAERLSEIRSRRDSLNRQLAEATRRKEDASELRKEAERFRSKMINEVFDEGLNRTWSDIFRRLVPSEPFTPRFKRQAEGNRSIDVVLETVDRTGEVAGSPGTMLSFGNVNTAALSLFLSLHFAVPTRLPWIVLDDPVQSMDDIHVANFSAMVKQLVRSQGRQIIIAVHQRDLFNYLALEFTPASPAERLITVDLSRESGATKISVEELTYSEDRSLSQPEVA